MRLTFDEALSRVFFAPVAAVRPYLALKGTLFLLTLDMWLTRASHAGRYGAGGFNVAHWPWLDWVQPQISPPLYVGACVLTSILSMGIVFGSRPPRWLIGLTLGVHTWSWAMSMLDSYQHHYLLSLVLLCMVFFPPMNAEEALGFDRATPEAPEPPPPKKQKTRKKKKKTEQPGRKRRGKRKRDAAPEASPTHSLWAPYPLASTWAYGLLSASIAIVYAYTSFSKTAPEWLSGASLQRVIHYPAAGAPAEDANVVVRMFHTLAEADGSGGAMFFHLMGHSVVLLQLVCLGGYLLAPWRDATRSPWMKGFFLVAMVTALAFHFGAELMGLEIGWFGYFMIGYAVIFMSPAEALVPVARAILTPRGVTTDGPALLLRAASALAVVGVGWLLDWTPPLYVAAAILLVAPLRWLARARWATTPEGPSAELALGLCAVAAVALVSVGWSADLPGTREATVVGAALLASGVVAGLVTEGHARAMTGYAIGTIVCALLLLASLTWSDMRWDYWRNVGGDHRRRGEVEEAYRAYVMANHYAPEGEDRHEQEAQMRAILVERGVLPPEAAE